MTSMAAAAGAALVSGVVMYTVGARTTEVDAFVQTPALVETGDRQGQYLHSNRHGASSRAGAHGASQADSRGVSGATLRSGAGAQRE